MRFHLEATTRLFLISVLTSVLSHAQQAPPSVEVNGAVEQKLALTEDDLLKMPRGAVRLESGGGTYEGVWLYEI